MSDAIVGLAGCMKNLGETMERSETRGAYVERRLMDENMLPHEGCEDALEFAGLIYRVWRYVRAAEADP